jgi:alpha-amylase/alpha-mannosidase (GH57 family)
VFVSKPLRVVLCWHMHQPEYRVPPEGHWVLPWTYLHAIKDYVDMAAHLEATPGARAVVNFAPTLIEGLVDYAREVRDALAGTGRVGDPLLATLLDLPPRDASDDRAALIGACLRAQEQRVIARFPDYARLVGLARAALGDPSLGDPALGDPSLVEYLDDSFLSDLVVWYHLAWLGETVRRDDAGVRALIARGRGFGLEDRRFLLRLVGDLLDGVLERYRALSDAGRVELSVSPFAHPIVPLLEDFGAARQSVPDAVLPADPGYPGGAARAERHVRRAREVFEAHFGRPPRGCWPSEGAVSDGTLALLERCGFDWAASGEGVVRNSLSAAGVDEDAYAEILHRPFTVRGGTIRCFFRSDALSDLIGFSYADWHADDAVANLVSRIEELAGADDAGERVLSIIMDGENAWEHYPENAVHFLGALYTQLSAHPGIRLSTFSECLDAGIEPRPLPGLVAGSWVYGTLSTWIGDPDKNRAWEVLCEAKRVFDAAATNGLEPGRLVAAERQLAVCEGSDWFWWYGDYNPEAAVRDFDRLFREQVAALYGLLGHAAPAHLAVPLATGSGTPAAGGVMRPGGTTT